MREFLEVARMLECMLFKEFVTAPKKCDISTQYASDQFIEWKKNIFVK